MVYLHGYMSTIDVPQKSNWQTRFTHLWKPVVVVFLINIGLSFGLAFLANRYKTVDGWTNFLGALLFATLLLWGGWRILRVENPPRWLGGLIVGAAVLRLALGALWFVALPNVGFGSPAERTGYVMADAYNRDRAAWRAAKSDLPLSKLITGRVYRKVDQYGGLLWLSAAYYRLLDGNAHRPLLMIVLTASISALAVLFVWGLGKMAFGEGVANLAAWLMALYPEAVLLGSAQMREAFLIPFVALSLYGLLRWQRTHQWQGAIYALLGLLLTYPFSPPSSALLLFVLVSVLVFSGDQGLLRRKRFWFALILVLILIAIGIWVSWGRYAPEKYNNPLSLAAWWFKISAGLQTHLTIQDSGWMQKVARPLPQWMRFILMTFYGVSRPLLPAALIAQSAKPFWQAIAVWRSVGWTILLPFLLVAPILAMRRVSWMDDGERRLALALSLGVWVGVLVASMRGGADLWDNPRYRALLTAPQLLLAAWVWVRYRQHQEGWIKHVAIALGLILLWFIPWYLRRYTSFYWPLSDFYLTMGLGVTSALIYGLIVWWVKRISARRGSSGDR